MKKWLLILAMLLFSEFAQANPLPPMQLYDGYALIDTPATSMTGEAIKLYKNNQYDQALASINNVILCYPKDPQANFIKSQIDVAKGSYEQALNDVNIAISSLEHSKLFAWRAYIYLKMANANNNSKIYKDLQKVLTMSNTVPNNLYMPVVVSREGNDFVEKVIKGKYNQYIWSVIYDKTIPSDMKSGVYKYLMTAFNSNS